MNSMRILFMIVCFVFAIVLFKAFGGFSSSMNCGKLAICTMIALIGFMPLDGDK